MTLDEAIRHCEEVAENYRCQRDDAADINDVGIASDCQNCADEHEQLASWLRELKELREEIGRFSRKWMEKHYREDILIKQFTDVYDKLLAGEKIEREGAKEYSLSKEFLYNRVYDFRWENEKNKA